MSSNHLRENLCYLSSLAKFNTERRPVIRRYLDQSLQSGKLLDETVSLSQVREFGSEKGKEVEEGSTDFGFTFEELILAVPEDIRPRDFQEYLLFRYCQIEDQLKDEGQFTIYDLLSFEVLIRDSILEEGDNEAGLQEVAQPETWEEYADFSEIKEPSSKFRQNWSKTITLEVKEVLREFVLSTVPDDPLADPSIGKDRLDTARQILDFLSYSSEDSSELDFFLHPLFLVGKNEKELVVPFPEVLITTAQYRIEEYIGQFAEVQQVENQKKGGVVEELAQELLKQVPSRNFIKGFHYIGDPHPGEADGLLFFEDSYWAVEVKSHPIFRKVPDRTELVRSRFTQKVKKAIGQTRNVLDYLDDPTEEFGLVFNFTGRKNRDEMDKGSIVVLDGFLPTLFSGNERADREIGLEELHAGIDQNERVLVITLYDLYQLIQQPEIEAFDEYLGWRTGYDGNLPVWGFNEREYWAFYFNNYRDDAELQHAIDDSADREIITIYISERFNDKSHLQKLVRRESGLS